MSDLSSENIIPNNTNYDSSTSPNNITSSPHPISNGVNTTPISTPGSQPPTGQIADINSFFKYLKQFVPVLLDSSVSNTLEFEKCLNEKQNIDCIRKFLGDSQIRTLIIQKYLTKGITILKKFCILILTDVMLLDR